MRSSAFAALWLFAAATIGAQEAAKPQVDVPTLSPRAEDVSSIDGMIKAYYDVISGPAGKAREWGRDRTLYIEDLRFVSVDVDKQGRAAPRIMDHQAYVDRTDVAFRDRGFFEREIHRVTERFGPIAHVWSTYESRQKEDGPIIIRGINSIELFWDGKRWWIANAIWTDERPDLPIPKEYLPN
ncbi:MAG TPA: nuclear transport factor 2 family protein [Thermoanaerobaculia bacterium]|jgi:hypothetical protein